MWQFPIAGGGNFLTGCLQHHSIGQQLHRFSIHHVFNTGGIAGFIIGNDGTFRRFFQPVDAALKGDAEAIIQRKRRADFFFTYHFRGSFSACGLMVIHKIQRAQKPCAPKQSHIWPFRKIAQCMVGNGSNCIVADGNDNIVRCGLRDWVDPHQLLEELRPAFGDDILVDDSHRLAPSRKAVASWLAALAASLVRERR